MTANLRFDGAPAEPWEGNGPCKDCGGRNWPWKAPHELWESVMECEPGSGGVVCATCFVVRAHAKGLGLGNGLAWLVAPVPAGFDTKMPLEGRVRMSRVPWNFGGGPVMLRRRPPRCSRPV